MCWPVHVALLVWACAITLQVSTLYNKHTSLLTRHGGAIMSHFSQAKFALDPRTGSYGAGYGYHRGSHSVVRTARQWLIPGQPNRGRPGVEMIPSSLNKLLKWNSSLVTHWWESGGFIKTRTFCLTLKKKRSKVSNWKKKSPSAWVTFVCWFWPCINTHPIHLSHGVPSLTGLKEEGYPINPFYICCAINRKLKKMCSLFVVVRHNVSWTSELGVR